jgi:hypothetical protein
VNFDKWVHFRIELEKYDGHRKEEEAYEEILQ